MAAIVIMALAFAVLLKAMGSSVALTHKAAARTEAAAWAQSLLDSAYVMQPPQPGVTAGRFDATYRWRLRVSPWRPPRQGRPRKPQDGDGLRLYKLDLAVTWGVPPRRHVAHFATLRVVRGQGDGALAP